MARVLGGRRFRSDEFDAIGARLRAAATDGGSAEPQLLFSETEHRQVLDMLRVAGHAAREA